MPKKLKRPHKTAAVIEFKRKTALCLFAYDMPPDLFDLIFAHHIRFLQACDLMTKQLVELSPLNQAIYRLCASYLRVRIRPFVEKCVYEVRKEIEEGVECAPGADENDQDLMTLIRTSSKFLTVTSNMAPIVAGIYDINICAMVEREIQLDLANFILEWY